MNVYLDSSVILRKLLNEPHPLVEFSKIERTFCSRLVRLECFRTLDRIRLLNQIDDEDLATLRQTLFSLFEHVEWIALTEAVLAMAEGSFSTKLGSLDAIHLSSAILAQKKYAIELTFATHDKELSTAAKASDFDTIG